MNDVDAFTTKAYMCEDWDIGEGGGVKGAVNNNSEIAHLLA